MKVKDAEEELKAVFEKFAQFDDTRDIAKRGFALCDYQKKSVLFFGANPSFQENDELVGNHFDLQRATNEYKRYYKQFEDLAKAHNVGDDYTYLDFLNLRETNQKIIDVSLLKAKNWKEFIKEQLLVTQKIIEFLKPKIIVVCNASAGKFLGIDKFEKNGKIENVWMGYNFDFDTVFGVNVISGLHNDSIKIGDKSTNLIGTPVIFTGYLKYLSSATKRTLGWQIENVLNNYEFYFGNKYNSQNVATVKEQIRNVIGIKV